jgi:hypothetical protein
LLTLISKIKKLLNVSPEPAVEAAENKPSHKPLTGTEPKKAPLPEASVSAPLSATEPKSAPIVEPKTIKKITLPPKDSTDNLPQDSTLRRHFLSHLRSMIEFLNPPRPADSTLSRHYDALIKGEIEQCIRDKGAIERIFNTVEGHKKTLAQPVQATKTPIEPLINAAINPEQPAINDGAKADIPLPPTDSVLRRHYDTLINNEINSLLEGK